MGPPLGTLISGLVALVVPILDQFDPAPVPGKCG